MNLLQLDNNKPAKVIEIVGGSGLERKLQSLGLRIGSRVLRLTSSSGPVVIKIGNIQLAIGKGMAAKIIVEQE
jgi:Fe2+ transport system protein FeoA